MMTAEELMIGNYVWIYSFPNENPVKEDLFLGKIVSILDGFPDEELHTIECVIPKVDGGYGVCSRPIDTCLPIPLTRKKLEENGAVFYEWTETESPFQADYGLTKKSVEFIGDNNKHFICEVDDSCADGLVLIASIYGNTTEIRYWHELQNALTVCKIKKEFELC